jgi:hypothetical protein
LTERARKARETSAGKSVQAVNAGGAILTRVRSTFVDVRLTEGTRIAREAGTREGV